MSGRRWVIADTHFGHANAIAYCGRPFADAAEMEEALVRNWNARVGKGDAVFVLGDFTLTARKPEIARLCARLNGSKVLIMGNHDVRKPKDYVECGFSWASRKPVMVEPNAVLMHVPPLPEDVLDGARYVFGHVHGMKAPCEEFANCACVCVERTGYAPVDLDALLASMPKSREGRET